MSHCASRWHPLSRFEKVFATFGLELPVVHSGWFAELPADEYPTPIAFAFLDGDFYSSVRKGAGPRPHT